MSESVVDKARLALDRLRGCLSAYAQARLETGRAVGQFLDRQGAKARHHGVYGTSGWLALTDDSVLKAKGSVERLRERCIQTLNGWLSQSPEEDSSAYELNQVVPKIADAFAGLRGTELGTPLLNRLRDCRTEDKGFGFLTSENRSSPVSTCMVLRSLEGEHRFRDRGLEAHGYLLEAFNSRQGNAFELLLMASTLLITWSFYRGEQPDEFRKEAEKFLKILLKSAARNWPTVVNPLCVDFDDGDRLRTVRIPTDVLLLESLLLVRTRKDGGRLFLSGGSGFRAFAELVESVPAEGLLKRDSAGNRPAVSSIVFARALLDRIVQETPHPVGKLRSYWALGEDVQLNTGFGASLVLLWLVAGGPFWTLIGALTKPLYEILKAWRTLFRRS